MNQSNRFTSKDISSQIAAMETAAYQRGWNDAIAAIQASVSRAKPTSAGNSWESSRESKVTVVLKPGSMIEAVRSYIKSHPGKSRPELAGEMLMKGVSSSEQSLRTSMKRLVKNGLVENRGGALILRHSVTRA